MKGAVVSALFQLGFLASVAAGTFGGVTGALNVGRFYAWACAVLALFAAYGASRHYSRKPAPPTFAFRLWLTCALAVGMFAWHGHFFSAGAVLASAVCLSFCHE